MDRYDKKILDILYGEKRTYTVIEIARATNLSVPTAERKLRHLERADRAHKTVHGYASPKILIIDNIPEENCAEQAA